MIYKDRNNEIWAGGYNYFGKIQRKGNGELYLQTVGKQGAFRGEVQEIWEEKDNSLNFFVNDGNIYEVKDNQFHIKKQISKERLGIGLSDVVDIDKLEETGKAEVLSDVTQREPLGNGLVAVVKRGQGLVITDNNGKELYTITETNGLCTNSVVYIAYDGHGRLWGHQPSHASHAMKDCVKKCFPSQNSTERNMSVPLTVCSAKKVSGLSILVSVIMLVGN